MLYAPPAMVVSAPAELSPLPDWAIGPFVRRENDQPVITPNKESVFDCPMRGKSVHWEALHTFNPAAIVKDGKVFVLYRAEDDTGEMTIGKHTSRLGLAESEDGVTFKRSPAPVFFPAEDGQKENEWDGGCEDPRIVEKEDGPAESRYVLTYTQWNRKVPRLAIATTSDLVHWVKHGPAFEAVSGEKYRGMASKSGSIVTAVAPDGRLKATKVNGKYWLYWGEGSIHLAWSDDLVSWHMVEDERGRPKVVLAPQRESFDSPLSECGPPAVVTEKGIVLLYNGKNDGKQHVEGLGKNAYAGGEALFSLEDPTKLVDRLKDPFVKPERDWEKTGQYAAGTTFIEGLVRFKGQWLLYYGCADSRVGVVSAK